MKRKIEKHRAKVLRSESVLQKNQFVLPVSASIPKKFDKRLKRVPKVADVTGDDLKVCRITANTRYRKGHSILL